MEIEKAIKQKVPFKSPYEKAIVNIFFTSTFLIEKMRNFLKPYGITHQQYNVLRILRGQHPNAISIGVIRERMLDKMSDASRVVSRLIAKNLVEKQIGSTDKRLVDVRITEIGLTLLTEIDKEIAFTNHILSNLSEQETQLLNSLLDKIRD
ncbi:MAG: winged helix-turn-helix transcriptional regulator [Chitinophagales bacterium]|jgi:DNA-binding MarR family transcriptional regulator|nr:winged helix-turn-helix transcriptional regulator [Chitinophagales bacterium]